MIRRSTDADKEQLKQVYNEAFPGEEEFCRYYFDTHWRAESTLVYYEGDVMAAAVQDPLIQISVGDGIYDGSYIFAAGTRRKYRGQGIMGELLRQSFEEAQRLGRVFSALIVQVPSLLDYYSRFDYEIPVNVGKASVIGCNASGVRVRSCQPSDLPEVLRIYEKETAELNALVRSIGYYETMLEVYGDKMSVLVTDDGNISAYGFEDKKDGIIYCPEVFGEHKELFASLVGAEYYHTSASQGSCLQIGALKPLGKKGNELFNGKSVYMNILFN